LWKSTLSSCCAFKTQHLLNAAIFKRDKIVVVLLKRDMSWNLNVSTSKNTQMQQLSPSLFKPMPLTLISIQKPHQTLVFLFCSITCFYLITIMVMRASSCGLDLKTQFVVYDCPDYGGYTSAPTRMQTLYCLIITFKNEIKLTYF